MVKHVYIFLSFALLAPGLASAITPDELRALDANAQREQAARDARVKAGEADKSLPKPKASPPTPAVKSNKYSNTNSGNTNSNGSNTSSPPRAEPAVADDNTYVAPARSTSGKNVIKTDAVPVASKNYFGISIGTWFKAQLTRQVSNADSGLVEIRLLEDVPGYKRTLPVGTLLFAEKQFNAGTKRLDIIIVRGITPTRHEFKMKALSFDLQKVSGLSGIINANEQASVQTGTKKGLLGAATAAMKQMGGGNAVMTEAAKGAADSVLSDTGKVINAEADAPYTIFVPPQQLLVQVQESF